MEAKIGPSNKRIKTADYKINEEILEEFKVEPTDEKLRRYKSNWLRHATRINNKKTPNVMLKYTTNE